VRAAGGKVPVVAGTGSNSTKKSIESSEAALEAGADAVMIVMPYYNKPSQLGMVRHVEAIAKAVAAPIVLYNIPGRSAVELSVESTLRILDSCDNVVAVKDATGGVLYCQELLCRAGDRIAVLSGDDVLTLPMMSIGAVGVISVTANLLPTPLVSMVGAALSGDFARARAVNRDLYPIHRALFTEPNPQPVKAALAAKRLMSAAVRPPLVEASPVCVEELAKVLAAYEGRAS
jgi:4-hydroxy-tetrahydrodipicolinate synthase